MNFENEQHAGVVSDWAAIQHIINLAPLCELQEYVAELNTLGRPNRDLHLMQEVEKLMLHAYLGNTDAIEDLVKIGCEIAHFFEKSINCPAKKKPKTAKVDPIASEHVTPINYTDINSNWIKELESIFQGLSCHPEDTLSAFTPILSEFYEPMFDTEVMRVSHLRDSNEGGDNYGKLALLTDLRNRLIDCRLRREIPKILKRFASKTLHWPVKVSAISDRRSEKINSYLSDLELGCRLGIKLNPGTGPGNKRVLENNSHGWAVDIYIALNQQRNSSLVSSAHRKRIMEKNQEELSRWQDKAISLDVLAEQNVDLWVDAAMSYIKSYFDTDYDDVPWPENITHRAETRGESLQAVARALIKKHFKGIIDS